VGASLVSAGAVEGPTEAAAIPEPLEFVTRHEGVFNGVGLNYTARAGETFLRDDAGEPRASVFSFAYTATDPGDPTIRPVIFIWNGGPGSSSVWLHMGTFGPRRVEVPSDAENAGSPPYAIVDNPSTVLDIADLVFVDPVGTGFSRPLGDHEGTEFWGLNQDAELTLRRHAFLQDRIEFTYYEAGHLMYVHGPSLERFMTDVRRFIEASLP
jgi:carboxypeptidase C (cathepsin A)